MGNKARPYRIPKQEREDLKKLIAAVNTELQAAAHPVSSEPAEPAEAEGSSSEGPPDVATDTPPGPSDYDRLRHELDTIIHVILGWADAIDDPWSPPWRRGHAAGMRTAARVISTVVLGESV